MNIGVAYGSLSLRPLEFRETSIVEPKMGKCYPDYQASPYYPYDPDSAEQHELAAFLTKIYPDEELREFVLTLFASCLEHENKEQRFICMIGNGSNGKSAIETLMTHTFGDYAGRLRTETLTQVRPSLHTWKRDIVSAEDKRYITVSEPDEGQKLHVPTLLSMCEGAPVFLRSPSSEEEKVAIKGTVFVTCNTFPALRHVNAAFWNHVLVIPHTSKFLEAGNPLLDPSKHIWERDVDLAEKLLVWRTPFLSLLTHYYVRYCHRGLEVPESVIACTEEWKTNLVSPSP
jgi:putative DNA primase/helicase